jgi:putative ATP-dependent endonuclease of the OLD family
LEVISVGGKGLFKAYGELLSACQVPYSIIADRDYLEQIGNENIRDLFKLDEGEIKKDVIDNPKSYDGKTLVARIDEAMAEGSWIDAQNVWAYIRSRRKQLRTDLTASERQTIREFILGKRDERIYVLNEKSLESYLPEGYRDKDLEKLIGFVASDDFWSKLSLQAQQELGEIARLLMPDLSAVPS